MERDDSAARGHEILKGKRTKRLVLCISFWKERLHGGLHIIICYRISIGSGEQPGFKYKMSPTGLMEDYEGVGDS